MKIFYAINLDGELFNEAPKRFLNIDRKIISIGMVSETGHTFYAEGTDFDNMSLPTYYRNAVLPTLYLPLMKYISYDHPWNIFNDNSGKSPFYNISIKATTNAIIAELINWINSFSRYNVYNIPELEFIGTGETVSLSSILSNIENSLNVLYTKVSSMNQIVYKSIEKTGVNNKTDTPCLYYFSHMDLLGIIDKLEILRDENYVEDFVLLNYLDMFDKQDLRNPLFYAICINCIYTLSNNLTFSDRVRIEDENAVDILD